MINFSFKERKSRILWLTNRKIYFNLTTIKDEENIP
jgi:hypothetical protein